jgi:hypothetical protein
MKMIKNVLDVLAFLALNAWSVQEFMHNLLKLRTILKNNMAE